MKQVYLIVWLCFSLGVFAQEKLSFESKHLHTAVDALFVKPEGAAESDVFPTLILLHGHGANYLSWNTMVDLQEQANQSGFAFLCPDGLSDSWYLDSKHKNGSAYYSFFVSDFLPQALAKLPIDSAFLFIDGYSMGGHGAMYFFLQNPSYFCAAGAISGVLNLKYSGNRNGSLKAHLGAYAWDDWKTYMAIYYLSEKLLGKKMIVDCGISDHLRKGNVEFVQKARQLGLAIDYAESEGGHNARYWRRVFPRHLAFFAAIVSDSAPK